VLPVLESLLDPISPAQFREQYYGRQPLLVRGHPKKFDGLFTWDDLNRLLNALSYPHYNVETTGSGGRSQASNQYSLIERCRAGDSLIFTYLHLFDPKIGELARSMETETGEPMSVTLVLSQPSRAAFARHFDRQDVFVLHMDGHKAWQVYDRTVDRPVVEMYDSVDESARSPTLECELAPGDVLYIPRGYWHQALAQRGSSLHLSLVMSARTGIDFMTWLVDQLRRDVRFRYELPLSFAEEPAQLREERLREHVAGFGELLLSRLADPETIRSFDQYCVLSDRDVRRFKFPVQLSESPVTQLGVRHFSRPARQRFVLEDGPTEDEITLSVWGFVFQFPRTARPLVELIFSRTSLTYDDALAHAGELTEQGLREVLDRLLREGILDAAGAPTGGR